jgi:hypothetical protein
MDRLVDYREASDWFGLRFHPSVRAVSRGVWEVDPGATGAQKSRLIAWFGQ